MLDNPLMKKTDAFIELVFENDGSGFEDDASAILPLHSVGVPFESGVQAGVGVLGYEFQFGNGPSYNTDSGYGSGEIEINNVSDPNRSKSPIRYIVRNGQ